MMVLRYHMVVVVVGVVSVDVVVVLSMLWWVAPVVVRRTMVLSLTLTLHGHNVFHLCVLRCGVYTTAGVTTLHTMSFLRSFVVVVRSCVVFLRIISGEEVADLIDGGEDYFTSVHFFWAGINNAGRAR